MERVELSSPAYQTGALTAVLHAIARKTEVPTPQVTSLYPGSSRIVPPGTRLPLYITRGEQRSRPPMLAHPPVFEAEPVPDGFTLQRKAADSNCRVSPLNSFPASARTFRVYLPYIRSHQI